MAQPVSCFFSVIMVADILNQERKEIRQTGFFKFRPPGDVADIGSINAEQSAAVLELPDGRSSQQIQ